MKRQNSSESNGAVYCVGTPFQILSAIEAKKLLGHTRNTIILRIDGKRLESDRQNELTLALEPWDRVIRWHASSYKGKLSTLHVCSQARYIAKQLGYGCDTLLISGFGQFRAQLLRGLLNAREVLLMDDGTATLSELDNYFSRGNYAPSSLANIYSETVFRRKLREILYGFNIDQLKKPFGLFTAFNLSKEKTKKIDVIHHNFAELRKARQNQAVSETEIFYFGSPLSEKGFLALSVEVALLSQIQRLCQKRGQSFIYIPHRFDSERKINDIKEIGITVKPLGIPAELYFVKSSKIPSQIATSISTALFTVSLITPEIEAEVFSFEPYFSGTMRETAQRIETAYYEFNITIVRNWTKEALLPTAEVIPQPNRAFISR